MSTYHIFLVDSDRSHAQRIKNHLKGYSEYAIDVFTDWIECRKKLSSLRPAVVFVDEELKHDEKTIQKDVEWMKGIKELSPDTEVVLFTGEERMHLMADNIKNGMHDFVVKSEQSHIHAETAILSAIRNYRKSATMKYEKVLSRILIAALLVVLGIAIATHYLGLAA